MKKQDIESLANKLASENEVLTLALNDVCNGGVKWFGHTRTYSIGISRPNGAAGGIAIVREAGMTYAFYFERYSRETLDRISSLVTGSDSEYNAELLRRRSAIEAAQAYVSESQRAA